MNLSDLLSIFSFQTYNLATNSQNSSLFVWLLPFLATYWLVNQLLAVKMLFHPRETKNVAGLKFQGLSKETKTARP